MEISAQDQPLARWLTITLDGQDVTSKCAAASEQAGTIRSLSDAHGAVVIALRPDAPEYIKTLYLGRRTEEAQRRAQMAKLEQWQG